jgi:hypothetical protein
MIVDNLDRSTNYFSPAHKEGSLIEGVPSAEGEESESEGLLVEKLKKVAGAYYRSRGVSSPFDLVPNEILSLILEHGYFGTKNGLPDNSFRGLVRDISRRFREVALQTPSLWASVHLSPSNVFDEVDLLPTYLGRSKSYPLDIHLSCFWAPDLTEQVMELMTPHSPRWKRLSITIMNGHALKFLADVAVPSLNLLIITFYSNQRRIALPSSIFKNELPQLQYLSLRNVDLINIRFTLRNIKTLDIRGYGIWPNFRRLNELIGQSTHLQRLVLHVKPAEVLAQLRWLLPGGQSGTLGQVILPALEYLLIHTSEWLTADVADFIRLFHCPKLKVLVLQDLSSQTEKPNAIMTYLVRTKRLEPVALEAVWTEAWEGRVEAGSQAKSDGLVVQPTLWVKSADLHHAYSAIACSLASRLTALELNGVLFPSMPRMKEIFAGLKNLQYLSMFNLVPSESLVLIKEHGIAWEEMVGAVDIPSLLTLVIAFRPTPRNQTFELDGTDLFLSLFKLPSLSSLLLKNPTFNRWCKVADVFLRGGVQSFPKLTSLKVVDMEDSIPVGSFIAGCGNPVAAFPRLEWLLLDGINSTCFLQCLLASYGDSEAPAWRNLTSLAIANDPCASRPLLHRVICDREALARPLKRLYLDSTYKRNAESFEWMKERVPVVEILPTRGPLFR